MILEVDSLNLFIYFILFNFILFRENYEFSLIQHKKNNINLIGKT